MPLAARIALFTIHYNRPDFLELQWKTLNKFLKEKDDFDLIVLNDAIDPDMNRQIHQVASEFDLICVDFPQELHHKGKLIEQFKPDYNGFNGSIRHCQIVQYILDNFAYDHDDIVGIMEGDVFLIRDFSIREKMHDYDWIGSMRSNCSYKNLEFVWIGLNFFNPQNLPNKYDLCFDITFLNKYTFFDSGGSTYYYLKNNPYVKFKKYYRVPIATLPRTDVQQLKSLGYLPKETTFLQKMAFYKEEDRYISTEFHIDNHFLHYSFSRLPANQKKLEIFKEFLNELLMSEGAGDAHAS